MTDNKKSKIKSTLVEDTKLQANFGNEKDFTFSLSARSLMLTSFKFDVPGF